MNGRHMLARLVQPKRRIGIIYGRGKANRLWSKPDNGGHGGPREVTMGRAGWRQEDGSRYAMDPYRRARSQVSMLPQPSWLPGSSSARYLGWVHFPSLSHTQDNNVCRQSEFGWLVLFFGVREERRCEHWNPRHKQDTDGYTSAEPGGYAWRRTSCVLHESTALGLAGLPPTSRPAAHCPLPARLAVDRSTRTPNAPRRRVGPELSWMGAPARRIAPGACAFTN